MRYAGSFFRKEGEQFMLIRYKKSYEKIAMGLLSYMPGGLTVKMLQETIHSYETDEDWQLFLWKKDDDLIGLLGIQMGEGEYTVHHISVNPSFRKEGIGREMILKLQQQYAELTCKSTEETEAFLQNCTYKEEGTD